MKNRKNRQNLLAADTAKIFGQLTEIAKQVKEGKKTPEQLQDFIEGCDPFEVPTIKKLNSKLFSKLVLQKKVTIFEGFSLDKSIVPKKEFKYSSISQEIRDKHFKPKTFSGEVTLTIVSTTKDATIERICVAANRQDALMIIAALHKMLVEDKHSLDRFKDEIIIVPILSSDRGTLDDSFCPYLIWGNDGWHWRTSSWLDDECISGVYVALITKK